MSKCKYTLTKKHQFATDYNLHGSRYLRGQMCPVTRCISTPTLTRRGMMSPCTEHPRRKWEQSIHPGGFPRLTNHCPCSFIVLTINISRNSVSSESKPGWVRNQLQNIFAPTDNKLAMKLFGSKKALMKERVRQKAIGHWIIHPCSSFR